MRSCQRCHGFKSRGDKRIKVTPEVLGEMRRLRGSGLSYARIAERFGLSMFTVCKHLRKEGRLSKRYKHTC